MNRPNFGTPRAQDIQDAISLHFCFTLGYRDVEKLLAARGIESLAIVQEPAQMPQPLDSS
jgi:hypothetical protein